MFRHLNTAIRFFHHTAFLRNGHAARDGASAALTAIAVRLKWFDVPPRKGGTFCFRKDRPLMRSRQCAHDGRL
jgi:hypothetical protein